jgi:hypothetical protein
LITSLPVFVTVEPARMAKLGAVRRTTQAAGTGSTAIRNLRLLVVIAILRK